MESYHYIKNQRLTIKNKEPPSAIKELKFDSGWYFIRKGRVGQIKKERGRPLPPGRHQPRLKHPCTEKTGEEETIYYLYFSVQFPYDYILHNKMEMGK
jgi:hypothetical protein